LIFADPTLADTSSLYLKLRQNQKIILSSPSSANPATLTQSTTYATASALISQQTLSGIPLIPEANYIEALASVIDSHNGT